MSANRSRCASPRRAAAAEDLAAEVGVEFDQLPVAADMLAARRPGAPLVHEDWGDNIVLEALVDDDLSEVAHTAPVRVTRTLRTARQCMAPIEGRGRGRRWDSRLDQLVLHSATQLPHIVRAGLAECLGLDHAQIRVVAPDVGGGFGYKGILLPRGGVRLLGWRCGSRRPVRWIEDRREHLTANANCREHHYEITGYAEADGRLLAVDCDATVDCRRLFVLPVFGLPRSGAGRQHPARPISFAGLSLPHLVGRHQQAADPALSRGRAGRRVLRDRADASMPSRAPSAASPARCGSRIWCRAAAMPFDNITGKHFDSGDYPECLRRAVAAIGLDAIRARQGAARRRDAGASASALPYFCEQGAHGTSVYPRLGHSDGAGPRAGDGAA